MCCSINESACGMFVNCLLKQFTMCLGVVAILLFNVMEVFSVGGGALWSSKKCACCACDPSVHLSVPSGSNDSCLHVVEPPSGRSFIWQN